MLEFFNKRNFVYLIWYSLGVGLPMLIGLIKNTIFTRVFTAKEYGYYTLITITYTYISLLTISWISGIIWRFYQKFKNENRINIMLSNIFSLFSFSSLILLVFTIIYLNFHTEIFLKKLIILSLFFYIFKELVVIFGVLLQLEKEFKTFNTVRIIQSLFGFFIVLLLVFKFNFRIESFLLSSIIIDAIILIFLFLKLGIKISVSQISTEILKEFLQFSWKNVIISFLLLGIVSADRYLISLYGTVDQVGIYNQIYNFSELSIGAIMLVLYGMINPNYTYHLENSPTTINKLVLKYMKIISLITLPIIIILSFFSKEITRIIFHEDFAKHYQLIPFVLISAYLYGLVNLIELKLKFENKMNIIILFYSICLIMNIILNVFFIPKYGFQFAALSTLITYIIMLVFFYWYYMLKVKLQ